MAIVQLPMDPLMDLFMDLLMERPMGQDLDGVIGMAGPTDTADGETRGMQDGVRGGDIPLIQQTTLMHLVHRLQCICSLFCLSRLC